MSVTEGGAGLPEPLRRAWGLSGPPASRGPEASLTLRRIVETAVEPGDAEGVEAISLTCSQGSTRLACPVRACPHVDQRAPPSARSHGGAVVGIRRA